jgi:hypothetical protein
MIGVPYNNDFEKMKKRIMEMAQNSKYQGPKINNYLLEKRTMDELLAYAQETNKRYGHNNFKTASYFKGHFKYLREVGWIIDEKDGYYQIIGYKSSTSAGQSSTEPVKNQMAEAYMPTIADCEKAIEKLRQIKSTHKIKINEILNSLESYFQEKRVTLSKDWRAITKINLKSWFK